MKTSFKRTVSVLIAVLMVVSIVPFTSLSAVTVPDGFKDYVFDSEFYAYKYPEVVAEYGSTEDALYSHYLNYGVSERKQGSPTFSADHYIYYNAAIKEQFGTDYEGAFEHYCQSASPSTTYQPSSQKFFAGSFDAVISRADDTSNGAFNVGVAATATDEANGKYNVQAVAADITDTKQIWTFKFNSSTNSYTITNKYTGTVLDVNGASKASGANVSTYKSNDSDAQKWRLLPRCDGEYVIAPIHASHFTVLDIGGSTAAGTNVKTYKYNHTPAQIFNIQILIPDAIKNIIFDYEYYAAKYPDVAKNYGSTEAELYEHFTKFGLMEGKQGSPVFSVKYYLDNNPDVKSSVGNHYTAAMLHYNSTGRNTTGLKTAPPAYLEDSFEATVNFINKNINLGIASTATNATNNAWNVETVTQSFTDTKQVWKFTYDSATGAYIMTNKAYPNAALDVSGASLANSTNVATYTNTGTDDLHRHMYLYERLPGEYIISPAHSSGKAIEVSGGYSSAGKNIAIYQYNHSLAQMFTLSYYFDPAYKSTIFDEEFYENEYYADPEIYALKGANLYEHFLSKGIQKGYQGSPVFSVSYYLENNADVKTACGDSYYQSLMHYINTGFTAKKYLTAPPTNFGETFTGTINSTTADVNIGVSDTASSSTVYMVKSRDRNDDAAAQQWMFVRNDNGSYTLTNVLSGGAMNANGGSLDNNTLINTYTPNNSIAQQWFFFERVPGQFVITPVYSSGTLALGVQGSALVEGTQSDLYRYSQVPAQLYEVTVLDYPGTENCDVNGDGIVNAKDILHVTKHVNKPFVHAYLKDSDVNGDGLINSDDLTLITQRMGESYGIWFKTLTADKSLTAPLYPADAKRHTTYSYDGITFETYEAVYAGFIQNGCEIYSDDIKGDLYTTTFTKGDDFYHMYWSKGSLRLRIVEAIGDAAALPAKNMYFPTCDVTPSITQLQSTELYGMGYVIQLQDGSFIIIDGGWAFEHDRLYNKLVEMNGGDKEDIVIRAWLISHAHGDHYQCFKSFAETYGSCVRLDYFMYSTGTPSTRNSGEDGILVWGSIRDYVNMFHDTKVLIVHTGMDFQFGNVHMEILYAVDDMYLEFVPDNQNETSIVCRFYTDKKSALVLADAGNDVAVRLEQNYGTYLKSDICQASHHGVEDFPLSTYEYIRAPIMMYPCSEELYSGAAGAERFKDVREAIAASDYIKEILIHQYAHYTRPLK